MNAIFSPMAGHGARMWRRSHKAAASGGGKTGADARDFMIRGIAAMTPYTPADNDAYGAVASRRFAVTADESDIFTRAAAARLGSGLPCNCPRILSLKSLA
jgi:hypothetical protein